MFNTFPETTTKILNWSWEDYAPYFADLQARVVTAESVDQWLLDWSKVTSAFQEVYSRLNVATTQDTTDKEAEERYRNFIATIMPEYEKASFALRQRLVETGLVPQGMAIPMRQIRAQIALFREENLPLKVALEELETRYNRVTGAQTVEWDGEEVTLARLQTVYLEQDRERRSAAWHLAEKRRLQDRDAYNDLWQKMMALRKQIYQNAGLTDYREYAWLERSRFDYSPEDAQTFCRAIEEVVVPVVAEMYAQRRQEMGLDRLRPWDVMVDPLGREALKPFTDVADFEARTAGIFQQVDPELGAYFQRMRDENLLDLDNRKGKAPGGYCTYFSVSKQPFIFMNSVGTDDDVRTMLHEAGHAFHAFSGGHHRYVFQLRSPMEFNEVASMAMELLASPYIAQQYGGYYDEASAARSRIEHLKGILEFWPYMAIVVLFQHWIYTHHEEATRPEACDEVWRDLWARYMPGIDYSGLEYAIENRWRRQLHIFLAPFYYIEYGLAQLGAVQIWARALANQQTALEDYRQALRLGGTVTLPELYESAGARLSFDAETLRQAVDLIVRTIHELEAAEQS